MNRILHAARTLFSSTQSIDQKEREAPDPVQSTSKPPKHTAKNQRARAKDAILIAEIAEKCIRPHFRNACLVPGQWSKLTACKEHVSVLIRAKGVSKRVTAAAVWKIYEKVMNEDGFILAHQHFCKFCDAFLKIGCCSKYDKAAHVKRWIVRNCKLPAQ